MSTPIELENELSALGRRIEDLAEIIAWHQSKRDWRKRVLKIADSVAQLDYRGPQWKAKAHAIESTERQQIDLDIAEGELTLCLELKHAYDQLVYTTTSRNKSASNAYNMRAY